MAVVRASDGATVASAPASPYADLDWGAGGLTVTRSWNASLTLYPEAPSLEASRTRAWDDEPQAFAAWAPDGRLAITLPRAEAPGRVLLLDAQLATLSEHEVPRAPFDEAAWNARHAAIPIPEYSTLTQAREIPASAPVGLALALALSLSLSLSQRRR